MSKTKSLHHIVIATKDRAVTLPEQHKRTLYKYIFGMLAARNCHVLRINGYVNHIHMLIDLHPTIALANLIREIKISTNNWLKSNKDFPNFVGWGAGYYACSVSPSNQQACIDYITSQEFHHGCCNFDVEIRRLMAAHGDDEHPNDLR